MATCPNCENYMSVGTTCTNCGHKDRDHTCTCSYCKSKVKPLPSGDRDDGTYEIKCEP